MTDANTEAKRSHTPLIEAKRLSRSYGALRAVRDLSFRVERGEVVGFLGPNGAGKSTTLRMLVGFLGPSSGSVRVAGYDMGNEPIRARQAIGYMAESAALYPEMRVREYLRFRAELKGLPRKERLGHVASSLKKTDLLDAETRLIGTLSKGYRQRVALADALLGEPPLLILDEPTAGLDPNQIRSVRQLIRELGREHTVLLSTHILSEVESTCTRVLVINEGRLVAEGPIDEVTHQIGGTQVALTIMDHAGLARQHLENMEGVQSVEFEASAPEHDVESSVFSLLVRLDPEVKDTGMALQMIVTGLVEADIGVREARVLESSLEDVFRKLTQSGEKS